MYGELALVFSLVFYSAVLLNAVWKQTALVGVDKKSTGV